MDETSHISPLRRWLESMLVWYILFMIIYLVARFIIQTDWRYVALLDNFAPYLFFPIIIGLLIALLLRSRRLSGLYLLVSLIGLLWVGLALIPNQFSGVSDEGEHIEIISFNLSPDNTELDKVSDWILAHSPDIVALQEIPEDISAFAELADAYDYSASLDSVTDSIVYSRYPILESGDVALEDWVIQRLVLEIESRQIVFYNFHLFMPLSENDSVWLALRYDSTRRDAQIRALLAQLETETLPLILAGDFNMSEWSPIYAELSAQLEDAYRNSSWGIGATFPAGTSEELNTTYPRLLRLDYIWYSEPIEASSAIVGTNLGSDHLPLIVELSVP